VRVDEVVLRPAPPGLVVAGWIAVAVACGALAVVAPLVLVGLGGLLLALVVLLRLPREVLPSLALAVYALVPLHNLPVPDTVSTLSPSLGICLVWVFRLRRDGLVCPGVRDGRLLAVGALLAGGLLAASALHGHELKTGVGWSVAFGLNVLLVAGALRREGQRTRELVVATWVALAGVLGVYGVLEAFVLHTNPFSDLIVRLGGTDIPQVWSTYRATTTLGHPLENAGFFALGAVLALARAVRTGSRWYALAVVSCLAGLAATASRGASVAALLGVVWVLAAERRRAPRARVVAVAATLALAVAAAGVVQLTRSGSLEADRSTQYRTATLHSGLGSVHDHPWLGVGPGASAVVKAEQGGSLGDLSYENGWLETAISDGLPFLLILVAMFAAGLWVAWRRVHVAAGAALAVAVIVIASSDVLEGNRVGLLRFGVLLGLAWTPAAAPRPEPRSEPQPAMAAYRP